jgi:TPP-dependent indolepyruvate ferredoxin oxidoreductase alpha subunit
MSPPGSVHVYVLVPPVDGVGVVGAQMVAGVWELSEKVTVPVGLRAVTDVPAFTLAVYLTNLPVPEGDAGLAETDTEAESWEITSVSAVAVDGRYFPDVPL